MSPRLLVVDADLASQHLLTTLLEGAGYTVQTVVDGQEALTTVALWRPDLVILELDLPSLPGLAVCQRLRGWSEVPILVVSRCAGEVEKVAALDAGADDYLTKPFGTRELLARVRVALRYGAHLNAPSVPVLRFGPLQINRSCRLVTLNGAAVRLTPTEYTLLALLSGHAGKVLTHQTILHAVWGADSTPDVNALRVFITQLRRKIEPEPARPTLILTEPGVGYRFRTEG
ncbi:MAG: response regulator transcription factor [Chloroflexales bacterium]|nr:response regulator transcription factor [Chloroflexales bacterium]